MWSLRVLVDRSMVLGPFDPSRVCGQRTRAITHTRTLRAMRVVREKMHAPRLARPLSRVACRACFTSYIRHKQVRFTIPYSVYSMLATIRSAPRRLCSPGGHSMLGWAPGLRHGEKKSGRKQRALPWCLQYRGHGCACRQVVYAPSPTAHHVCPRVCP